jgi:hypothetical protein
MGRRYKSIIKYWQGKSRKKAYYDGEEEYVQSLIAKGKALLGPDESSASAS